MTLTPAKSLSETLAFIQAQRNTECGLCQNGLLSTLDYSRDTTASVLLRTFVAGNLELCECEAGERMRAGLMKRSEAPSDAVLMAQAKANAVKSRKEKLFKDASVPPRFSSFTFNGYVKKVRSDEGKRQMIDAIKAHYKGTNERMGIMLCGPTGLGKTGALCPLFLHYMDKGYSGLWLPYFDMMAGFKDFEGGQVSAKIALAQDVNLLFIDDMGDPKRQAATDYEREVVFRLIDHRNNYGLPMFITSNLSVDRLEGYYRPEIVKRLEEACEIIPVMGERVGA